mmetsp:Transcript_36060/g.73538  ORF Transcript_36060/g.73538 Transcript_36060/m.73538 type:complete len:83 (+) Transcript_36060:95-343(+)
MTYQSRGRSMFEVVLAICFVAFLVGFITVLCIGNYFRAKRAQERQRQRREAKQAASGSTPGQLKAPEYEAPTLTQTSPGRLL